MAMFETNNPEIDIGELTARIEKELAARQAGSGSRYRAPSTEKRAFSADKLSGYQPFQTKVRRSSHPSEGKDYNMGQLTAFHDRDFVIAAYRAVLDRNPDISGIKHYLRLLRGGMPKAEILARLRYSPEGRSRGARIKGLLPAFVVERMFRLPVLGYVLRLIAGLLRLPQILADFRRLQNQVMALETDRADYLEAEGRELGGVLAALRESVDALQGDLRTTRSLVNKDALELDSALTRVEALERGKQAPSSAAREQDSGRLDALYASLGDKLRGSPAEAKDHLRIYLDVVSQAGAGSADAPVLDLGCGRGEWLELLREAQLRAWGVESNPVLVAACRDKGLEVVEADAVDYLRKLPSDSLGAVTGFHTVERLPWKTMIALFDESLRVLRPGGMVILETPNPGNLRVGSHYFYSDPTRRSPLPSDLIAPLLEECGFSDLSIRFLHPDREAEECPEGETEFLKQLRQLVFGPRDYAVIGRKR